MEAAQATGNLISTLSKGTKQNGLGLAGQKNFVKRYHAQLITDYFPESTGRPYLRSSAGEVPIAVQYRQMHMRRLQVCTAPKKFCEGEGCSQDGGVPVIGDGISQVGVFEGVSLP